MEQDVVSMKKYLLWYTLVYVLSSAILSAVLTYMDSESNSTTFIIVFASAYTAVSFFVKDHDRLLTKSEIWRLTWGSWSISILLTIIFVLGLAGYVLFDAFGEITIAGFEALFAELQISIGTLVTITFFVCLMVLGVTRLGYGVSNKIYSKKVKVAVEPT